MKLIWICIILFAIFAGNANAANIIGEPNVVAQVEKWEEYSTIKFGSSLTFVVKNEPCRFFLPRLASCADFNERPAVIYMVNMDRMSYYHEKAHIWNVENDDQSSRTATGAFLAHMDYPSSTYEEWWSTENTAGWELAYSAERFADALSHCSYMPKRFWGKRLIAWSGYGWSPTVTQARRVCSMFMKTIR